MKKNPFQDSLLNQAFEQNGYVILRSFLKPGSLASLMERFGALHQSIPLNTFFTSTHSHDETYRREVDKEIKKYLSPFAEMYLNDYEALYGNFMIKPAGAESICTLHQDWTFVEENRFRSLNLWIPLNDTNVTNGCFHLVPGSHLYNWPVRGRKIVPVYNKIMSYIVDNHLLPVPLAAGDAIVFDSATLHYSPENLTSDTRVATSLMFYPKESELIHYVYNFAELVLEKYHVTPDFFTRYGTSESLPDSEKLISKTAFYQEYINETDFNLLAKINATQHF